ncbi:MAG: polysaccharide biosynthesis/export family protein [Mucilaginibacter polytrichastri]|nr:polysaccharide biosynthesis/export family protein [Mucilaginibacter polytrichastri]
MQKKYLYLPTFILFVLVFMSSCASRRDISYFQKEASADTLVLPQKYFPKIQAGDIVSVIVTSLDAESDRMFNPYTAINAAGGMNQVQQGVTTQLNQLPASGYLVDEQGNISLPLIGKIKLSSMTTSQARDLITEKLLAYLKEPTVNVHLTNYKISVLGEVNRPLTIIVPNERITLPEAISLAGDLTITGRRNNIMVIREENGKKEFGTVNMNNRDIFNSPYYYLHPNDIVYVEPTSGKVFQSDRTATILAPIAISLMSLLVVIFR